MSMLTDNLGPAQMRQRFLLAAVGSVMAGAGVALAAYAAHATDVDEEARGSLQRASLFVLLHGVALAALAPMAVRKLAMLGLLAIAVGTFLFCGSLVAKVFWQWPTTLAPFGGGLMIAGWLLHAAGQWKR